MTSAVCMYCGEPVNPEHAYRRITGWERKAIAGSRRGGSDIVLREHTGEFACDTCIFRLQHGLSVAQESLEL